MAAMSALHAEIVAFCNSIAPTQEEKQVRNRAVERVRNLIKSIWPLCEVEVFGSFATGLYLPTSDVDIVIQKRGLPSQKYTLVDALRRSEVVTQVEDIRATVPIIKLVEKESGIPFDISFNSRKGPEVAEFITTEMETYPALKPVTLVLKEFLRKKILNEGRWGGLGSYALTVMILARLKMCETERPTIIEDYGDLLIDFLDYYGQKFNRTLYIVSCRNGGRIYPKPQRRLGKYKPSWHLSVEDPLSEESDIRENSRDHNKICPAFKQAYELLTNVNGDAGMNRLGRIVGTPRVTVRRN